MITPLDIENKKFNKQMVNGYNVDEVDDFLDELTADYGRNYKDLSEQAKKIEELNNSLNHYKTIEGTLQNTLVMAQSTAEEVKNVAKQQAEQTISEAKSKAEQIINDAKLQSQKLVEDLNQEILMKEKSLEDLKKQFDIYKAKMESLLISQLELLKEVNKEE